MTAVEWLFEQMPKKLHPHYKKQLQQAKEMEKQQIMNAWNNGFEENRPYVDHSEDYYNETFNKK